MYMDDFLLVTPINTSFIKPAQGMEMAIDQYKHNYYSTEFNFYVKYQMLDYLYSYDSWPQPPPTHSPPPMHTSTLKRGNIF